MEAGAFEGDATAPAITLEGVRQVFTSRDGSKLLALDRIDLKVAPREFLSLVGPSGCGKSTLLRLVAGLIRPTEGVLRVEGGAAARGFRHLGLVFQRPNLLPWLTVLDNVLYPVRIGLKHVDAEHRERAMALLDKVGLLQSAIQLPDELSGGMQQRAALCRGLILDPPILLMDEPFSALDALTREELQLELLRLQEATDKTVLFVTHSVNEAVLLSSRVAVMSPRPGRIIDLFDVTLARPRRPDVVESPEFLSFAKRIRRGIYGR
jgi:NitT/TauT family transport system ATP-binding protein